MCQGTSCGRGRSINLGHIFFSDTYVRQLWLVPVANNADNFTMSFLLDPSYYEVKKNGLSPAQNMAAYLGGSAIQTVGDNPVTAYRQLVQQYAKGLDGKAVDPKIASQEANAVFRATPVTASLSGLWPRLIGVLFKRVPKFGILLGYTALTGQGGEPGFAAATAASIGSAPFINPIRMIEKQQRAFLKQTGVEKPLMDIIREAAAKNFMPLFRGTIPLMGHSMASAVLGLVGQPRLQKYVQKEIGGSGLMGQSATNLVASAVVSPIYVVVTNPLSRLEVPATLTPSTCHQLLPLATTCHHFWHARMPF